MSAQSARNHSPDFKAEVALAAIRGGKTLAELASEFGADPDQITAWRLLLQENAAAVFAGQLKPVPRALPNNPFGKHYAGKTLAERV
jgi:transposase